MTASFTGTTTNPIVIPNGTTVKPFNTVVVNESTLPAGEILTITFSGIDITTLTDPLGGGVYNAAANSFTYNSVATAVPTTATQFLQRLDYKPPALTNGTYSVANVTISVKPSVFALPIVDTPTVLESVTAPAIANTIDNEPVASGVNASIRPFGSVRVTDTNYRYDAQDTGLITLTDAAGNATDADGLLTGRGLSKTGVGTYTLAANYSYSFQYDLDALMFNPSAVAAGSTRTTGFKLSVKDVATGLSTDDNTTSVLVVGATVAPSAPLIAGTAAGQTVAPGNAISPFNAVTISDSNANPQDSATLTVTGGGTLSGTGLVDAGGGVYTVAVTTPAALTAILEKLRFAAPPLAAGQASVTSSVKLDVVDGTQTASDSKTTITETAPLPPPPEKLTGNFSVADQTTGQVSFASGDAYSGPVGGLARELLLITPDNVNISASIPNVFIHSGSGTDAITVSGSNGNNILDGSTGSNFLVGGTGLDTFFLDDRNLTTDVFSTVVNFHSGDNVTVFGVNAATPVAIQDNLGAVGAKGLTYTFSAPGKPNASIVLTGFNSADLTNGRLAVAYGSNPDTPGQPGSGGPYLNIHGN